MSKVFVRTKKAKAVTVANHKEDSETNEPIKTCDKNM